MERLVGLQYRGPAKPHKRTLPFIVAAINECDCRLAGDREPARINHGVVCRHQRGQLVEVSSIDVLVELFGE